jgi:hypothetical protein
MIPLIIPFLLTRIRVVKIGLAQVVNFRLAFPTFYPIFPVNRKLTLLYTKTVTVPVEYLDDITATVAKDK